MSLCIHHAVDQKSMVWGEFSWRTEPVDKS